MSTVERLDNLPLPGDPAPFERPASRGVRRFWIACLICMSIMLAAFIIVVLIAAVDADPGVVPPQG